MSESGICSEMTFSLLTVFGNVVSLIDDLVVIVLFDITLHVGMFHIF